MSEVTETQMLAEGRKRYGIYQDTARIAQNIKRAFRASPNWEVLPDYIKESMDMLANKMARMLNGDWEHDDNLFDGANYLLIALRSMREERASQKAVEPASNSQVTASH
jgi:hypothetical protein